MYNVAATYCFSYSKMMNRFRFVKLSAVSPSKMKLLISVFETKPGKSNAFSLISSTIHTSNQPTLRLQDLHYAFDCIENIDEATSLFRYMLYMKPTPSIYDYHMLFKVVTKMEHYERVIFMFKELILLGCPVDNYIMSAVMKCYGHFKEVELCFAIIATFLKRGFPPDIVTFNCLITAFFLKGDVTTAISLFKKVFRKRDDYTIPIVLHGLRSSGYVGNAVDLLRISETKEWDVSVVGYSSVVHGLCKARMLKDGMDLISRMVERDVMTDVVTYNCFMHGLCNHGKLDFACSLFNDLPSKGICPDVISYNVIIQGLGRNGLFQEAKEMLEKMERGGCFPNTITYNIIIQACLHHLHSVDSINLLQQIVGRDFQLDTPSFFVLLGRIQVLRQMPGIYDDDVINQMMQKLTFSCPTRQMRDSNDEFFVSGLIRKLKERGIYDL